MKSIALFQNHSPRQIIITAVGAFAGIGTVTFLSVQEQLPLLIASFGASAVLLYGAPTAPMAQSRNVLCGHGLSALIGVNCYQLLGDGWFSMTLAVTLAIVLMLLTNTTHPPGGATALVCVMQHASYSFILLPVLTGALILLICAKIVNRWRP